MHLLITLLLFGHDRMRGICTHVMQAKSPKEMRQFLFLSPLHWRSSPRAKQFIFVGHKV
jgi:hypothetical protein